MNKTDTQKRSAMSELKARREAIGMSVYRLSKLTGIPAQTIARWEETNIEVKVTIRQQKALMDALKLETEEDLAILLNQSL